MDRLKPYMMVALLFCLVACDNNKTTTGIRVNAYSGSKVDITGEWRSGCYFYAFGTDRYAKDHVVISGNEVSYFLDLYSSVDTTCSGTPTRYDTDYVYAEGNVALMAAVSGEKAMIGWQNYLKDVPVSPNSQADRAALPDTPVATSIDLTWFGTETLGDLRVAVYVDDRNADEWVMYVTKLSYNMTPSYNERLIWDVFFTKQ